MLFSFLLEKGGGKRHSQTRETSQLPCHLKTDQPPERSGKSSFYITEGFKSKKKPVAIFFDITKAFDRVMAHTSAHTQLDVLSKQEFFKAPPSHPAVPPVFAHVAPKALDRLQVVQNEFCRDATSAHWCVCNSTLLRDLELPTIAKFMKDASKRFFDIAGSHSNVLLRSSIDYEPPHRHHFIRRPCNVLTDPPDALTAAVNNLMEVRSKTIAPLLPCRVGHVTRRRHPRVPSSRVRCTGARVCGMHCLPPPHRKRHSFGFIGGGN
ncbi:hypothetical protein EVAR_97409_1 [Eumeta japonica]|uniref:Uncharacterized protein n=1 Tax=Eumeta variegata TaxID=151549 RepID=A0A4C1WX09_EUMVA|nr:hypothetical protein EVAR_97409_1 [Eumeta japonica]